MIRRILQDIEFLTLPGASIIPIRQTDWQIGFEPVDTYWLTCRVWI
jgi:hypothetical protein